MDIAVRERAGLCADCRYVRVIGNDRGSLFYQCTRALQDPGMVKYPRLPVLACPQYVAAGKLTEP